MAKKKKAKRAVTRQLIAAARNSRTLIAREMADIGVHAGQDWVLLAIEADPGVALSDLARLLGVSPPTITKTIARLTQQGLIEKHTDDARRNRVSLTDKGYALVRDVEAAGKRVEKTALDGFSRKEAKSLDKLLRRVGANLRSPATAPSIASATAPAMAPESDD